MNEQQARDAYNDAKRKRNSAQENLDYNKRLRNQTKDDISDCKNNVRNLDERLRGLNRIIKFFENSLTDQFKEANKKAVSANDAFANAVFLSECNMANANISEAFYTDSVYANGDTNNAYDKCVEERDRVSNDIANLNDKINELQAKVNTLSGNVRYYNKLVNEYEADMRCYRRLY